jgi:hypothetical protein
VGDRIEERNLHILPREDLNLPTSTFFPRRELPSFTFIETKGNVIAYIFYGFLYSSIYVSTYYAGRHTIMN